MKTIIRMLIMLAISFQAIPATAEDALSVSRRASDMAASAVFPSALVSSGYVETNAAGEPYLIKCTAQANKIILFLHTWSNDYTSISSTFPELSTLDRVCVVSPNFGGPNSNPGALGSDDSIERINKVIQEVRYKTGLSRVYLTAASGGTMAALNYMGKYPDTIHRASLWLIIYDLSSLYSTTSDPSLKSDMVSAIGAAPTGPDDQIYLNRSPRKRLETISGSTKIFLNYGMADTSTIPAQAISAKEKINSVAPTMDVRLASWPIAHVFGAASRSEAIKQLVLE